MKYMGGILKAAAVVSLLIGIAAPKPRLLLIVLSAVLMTAGLFAGGSIEARQGEAGRKKAPEADKKVMITRVCLGAIAVVFIFYGVMNDGARAVLNKAIRICMECIGLG